MASTYTVANATTYVRKFIKGVPVSDIEVTAADMINSIIWNAYPWRWTLTALTAIALVDGTQDYAWAPADYMRIVAARIARTDVTPDEYDELKILRNLPPELTKAGFKTLSSIAYIGALSKLRLNFAAAVPTGATLEIQGEYQKQPTKITANSATFPFPDQYFPVFIEGYKWQLYLFADDPRAGNSQMDKKSGQAVYTGQMGIFYDALMSMREAEEWGAGDAIFPDDPLGAYRNSNPNIFGP